eukprot:TRINITY_DN1320_c0_g1_i10.p1 TRINITY_DN1320_c0_g1~~TRINITY_DN1320_c0_g1_i10.p1  ORF type:complete len:277 (-),score=37.33 TRINITY_DN1320_c0_g1_i10:93-923(-)
MYIRSNIEFCRTIVGDQQTKSVDWDLVVAMVAHLSDGIHRWPRFYANILFAVPHYFGAVENKILRKICKERLGAKSVAVVSAALLSLYSTGKQAKSGIVVTAGAITTAVIPIWDRNVVEDMIETFPYAEVDSRSLDAKQMFFSTDGDNLATTAYRTLMKFSVEQREEMLRCIVLSGGNFLLPDFKDAFTQQFLALAPEAKIFASEDLLDIVKGGLSFIEDCESPNDLFSKRKAKKVEQSVQLLVESFQTRTAGDEEEREYKENSWELWLHRLRINS